MEDDRVVVFDIKSKTSSEGIVLEVLGRNNYLVEVDGIAKHISGDCLSTNKSEIAGNGSGNSDPLDENGEENQDILWEDDNVSIASDSTASSISILCPQGPQRNIRNRNKRNRRRRMMLEHLNAPVIQGSRLRSGN